MSWLLPLALSLVGAASAAPAFVTGQSAAVVVGQSALNAAGVNGAPGVAASGLALGAGTMNGVWSDGTLLIVADTANNRVKIFNTVPTGSGASADVIVGQPDGGSSLANQGGAAAAYTLNAPTGVFYDGFFLYIADTGNHRVLIYQTLPQADNASADVVVGQTSFSGASANKGGAVSADGLNAPTGVYSDGTALFVADQGNHRVLSYAQIPLANDAFASYVVGQSSFNTNAANQGGLSNKSLSSPAAVWGDGTRLYVSDTNNNRALIFSSTPAANNLAASFVLGQTSFTTNAANPGGVKNNTLSSPRGIFSDGARIVVADASNNRVLIYAAIPSTNNVSADMVVGQTTFTLSSANQGLSAPTARTLSRPTSAMTAGQLFVSDQANNRALLYSPVPAGASYGAAASVAVGQSDFVTATANQAVTTPAANTDFRAASAQFDGNRLVVADRSNNRVLLFNTLPKANNASADVVVGQTLMSSASANMGGSVGAATLNSPAWAYSDGARLFVADQFNSRVLIYNAIPGANGAAASVVLGQPNKTSNAGNNGGLAANGSKDLLLPSGVHFDGTRVLVADRLNNRVLIWSSVPAADYTAANLVLGQTVFSSSTANAGGLSAASLNSPAGVYSDGTRLYVADTNNNRVLMWNAIPVSNDKTADVVIGQADFAHNSNNQGLAAPTAKTLSRPSAVWEDGAGALYIADNGNNRVLVYKSTPTASNPAADLVIGQPGFTTGKANQGASPAANTLSGPASVMVDSTTGRMFVADLSNNRALEFLPAATSSVTAAGGTVVFTSPIGPAQVVVSAPPLSFGGLTNLTFMAQTGFPAAQAPAASLAGTGVGMELDLDAGVQPNQEVTMTVTYRPADLAGFDRSKLVLARFDPLSAAWLPLVSVDDTANNAVTAKTNHFSLFQLMQASTLGDSVDTVVAFPNPLRPSARQHAISFASAPPGARLRVYTLSGTLLKDLTADNTGMARWDATNQAGASVASGVYFVFVQGGGRSAVIKVAIER